MLFTLGACTSTTHEQLTVVITSIRFMTPCSQHGCVCRGRKHFVLCFLCIKQMQQSTPSCASVKTYLVHFTQSIKVTPEPSTNVTKHTTQGMSARCLCLCGYPGASVLHLHGHAPPIQGSAASCRRSCAGGICR